MLGKSSNAVLHPSGLADCSGLLPPPLGTLRADLFLLFLFYQHGVRDLKSEGRWCQPVLVEYIDLVVD